MKCIIAVGFALALSFSQANAAHFLFTTGDGTWRPNGWGTPVEPVPSGWSASGVITISDEAIAAGLNINVSENRGVDWDRLGVFGLSFVFKFQHREMAITRDDFPPFFQGQTGKYWVVNLVSGPGEIPTGRVFYNDSETMVTYYLNGADSRMAFASDAFGGSCFQQGCNFDATFVAAVPEPSSVAMLAVPMALLGLYGVRLRGQPMGLRA